MKKKTNKKLQNLFIETLQEEKKLQKKNQKKFMIYLWHKGTGKVIIRAESEESALKKLGNSKYFKIWDPDDFKVMEILETKYHYSNGLKYRDKKPQ